MFGVQQGVWKRRECLLLCKLRGLTRPVESVGNDKNVVVVTNVTVVILDVYKQGEGRRQKRRRRGRKRERERKNLPHGHLPLSISVVFVQ